MIDVVSVMKLRYFILVYVIRFMFLEIYFFFVKIYDMELGIIIKVIKIFVKVMLMNNILVRDFVFVFYLMINIRRIFLFRVMIIVMEYSKIK